MKLIFPIIGWLLCINCFSQQAYKDVYFMQEYHQPYIVSSHASENEVRSITVDKNMNVFIATAQGVLLKEAGQTSFIQILSEGDKGPAYAVAADETSTVWMGTWNGVFTYTNKQLKKLNGTEGPVASICIAREGVYAAGPKGIWLYSNGKLIKKNYAVAATIRNVISDNKKGLWLATDVGLFHSTDESVRHYHQTNLLISAAVKGLAFDESNRLWAAGLGGVSILKDSLQQSTLQQANGIPSVFVNCIKHATDSVMWIGTNCGVVRFSPGGNHTLLFTRRWLLNDKVNDIAFDTAGNAWMATASGVSMIGKRKMNLESKAAYFYDVLMKRHIREPWIAGQCHLKVEGDISSWYPEDDDNDGEYTGNYLAMESFRYAVTKNEDAKLKAKKAFDFLVQLQTVTGGNGFFARTMVPVEWRSRVHDGNKKYTQQDLAEELVNDPRFKPVEERWHISADGKWLWKGDASSDEMCGHMMGYFFYYELAADETAKASVRKHIASIVDHLIANNYNMMDVDGTHTRWAVWSADLLNRDANWNPEKNENSMEMLAFLKLAYYVTNDIKYQQHYLHLINDEHYLENMAQILDQNPAWFIYFDVILQTYLYPILLTCETDPKLLAFYRQHANKCFETRQQDKSPLINFFYCYARNKKEALTASVDFLKDTPLDLIDWTVDHTKREDVHIVRTPVLDELQIDQLPPAQIRSVVRWDKNPWAAINGVPNIEREPVFWLLPYWMGRYLKMIE